MKQEKIKDYNDRAATYEKVLARLELLENALNDYKLENINKRFFEKYFTSVYTKEELERNDYLSEKDKKPGDVRKNWKGETLTDFNFRDCQYDYQKEKYAGEIYLEKDHRLQIETKTKTSILSAIVQEKVNINKNLNYCTEQARKWENLNLGAIRIELENIQKRHDFPDYSFTEIVKNYPYITN
jgi:hypothetical protein